MPKCFNKTPFIVQYHIRYKRKMTWKPAMEGNILNGRSLRWPPCFRLKELCLYYSLETGNIKMQAVDFFPLLTAGNKTGSWGKWEFCPYCVERPVEYPNGCLLEAGFMFHTQARRYVFRSYQRIGGTWSQDYKKPGIWINLPGSVCTVKRCSKTYLMGTLKIRSRAASVIRRKLSQKSRNRGFKGMSVKQHLFWDWILKFLFWVITFISEQRFIFVTKAKKSFKGEKSTQSYQLCLPNI